MSSQKPGRQKCSRHTANLVKSASPQTEDKRKRARRACDRCRLKKNKCDGSEPCSRCKHDDFICNFSERRYRLNGTHPQGYVELFEHQKSQLILCIRLLYRQLLQSPTWNGPSFDQLAGDLPINDILGSLNVSSTGYDAINSDGELRMGDTYSPRLLTAQDALAVPRRQSNSRPSPEDRECCQIGSRTSSISAFAQMRPQSKQGTPSPPRPALPLDSEVAKRNKLAYRRIPNACGMTSLAAMMYPSFLVPSNCRRRKIRCLSAKKHPLERCQNCIRFEKECVFYPVEQRQITDKLPQSRARPGPESAPLSAVSSRISEVESGRPFERSHQHGSLPLPSALPSNAQPSFGFYLGHGLTFSGQSEMMPGPPAFAFASHERSDVPVADYSFQHTVTDSQRHCDLVGDLNSPSSPMNKSRDRMQPLCYQTDPTILSTAEYAPFSKSSSSVLRMQWPGRSIHDTMPPVQVQAWDQSRAAQLVSFPHPQELGAQGYMIPLAGYPL